MHSAAETHSQPSLRDELNPTDLRAAFEFEWMLSWRRRRQRGTLLVGLLPVLFALLIILLKWVGLVPVLAVDVLPALFALAYVPVLLVILPLLVGTSLIAREAEANTLAFLLVRPVSRASLLLGKFLGGWVVVCVLLCSTLVLCNLLLLLADGFLDAGLALKVLPANLVALCFGAFTYTALFTLVGLVANRPALVGLFVAFLWENAIPWLPGMIQNFTVRYHLMALLPDDSIPVYVHLSRGAPNPFLAILWLIGGAALMLLLAVWIFRRRDYP
jgi:ABC-type transport system involved in multi-copper enzyme maturation permease subunit